MIRRLALVLLVGLAAGTASAQSVPPGLRPTSFDALVTQLTDLFPKVEGEVIEAEGKTLTVSVGRPAGIQRGLALTVFREGRELRHPKTGQVLGRTEQPLGRAVVTQVFESYSLAAFEGRDASPGDRVRVSAGKIELMLVPLRAGMREGLVEAATQEIYEALSRTGRFQAILGGQLIAWLGSERIAAEEFLAGRRVREAFERFRAENILALYFRPVDRKPLMEVRLFTMGSPDPMLTAAFFVPPSIKPATAGQFSASDARRPQLERKPRSFLARLLGGELEAGTYSSGEGSMPLKEIARFPFPVLAMDVSIGPADGVPRMAVTDGDRLYVYRIVNGALDAEWTYSARSYGRVISLQLADLDGDGVLEVVANRYDPRLRMGGLVVGLREGKPRALVDQVPSILLAVDETGAGVKRTLWAQGFSDETFFARGQVDRVTLKDGSLIREAPVRVPDTFRATGATISNVSGKGVRALVFVDEHNRLRIHIGPEEIWRSSSSVGGGLPKLELLQYTERGGRSKFFHIEPVPLSVDLDGDGVEEIVAPQNLVAGGLLAVIFRGPVGYRLQSVNSGFEGVITGLGAIPAAGGDAPTLITSVVRFANFLKSSGETQIIMTMPQE